VRIHLFATLRIAAGQSEIDAPLLEASDLTAVLTEVAGHLGEKFRTTLFDSEKAIARDVVVCLNSRVIDRGEHVLVSDSDEVSLLMPLAGG
jgi:molybdopterin converting factor small subunit